jgi:hypothetical protein
VDHGIEHWTGLVGLLKKDAEIGHARAQRRGTYKQHYSIATGCFLGQDTAAVGLRDTDAAEP